VRGSDDGEVVSPSSLKTIPRPRLANNFSTEVLSWFINDSSEETSSSVSSSGESEQSSSSPSSSESRNLFLVVIVVGCHSLEKREFREGGSDQLDIRERAIDRSFIDVVGGIFEETPRSWGTTLQIHSSNGLMTSYLLLH
jgi:hypothetical protein